MMIDCPKCGHQRSAADDPAIPEYQCPACGVIYAKFQRPGPRPTRRLFRPQINEQSFFSALISYFLFPARWLGQRYIESVRDQPGQQQPTFIPPTDSELLRDHLECQRWKTNHLLHFLLSLFGGLWLIPWLIVTASNTRERNKIHRVCNVPPESDLGGAIFWFFLIVVLGGVVIELITPP